MSPRATVEADASKELGEPAAAGVTVKDAVGASSGVTATVSGSLPTVRVAAALLVDRSIGVTVPNPKLVTYAVAWSGVIATASGSLPTATAAPSVPVDRFTGVAVPWL